MKTNLQYKDEEIVEITPNSGSTVFFIDRRRNFDDNGYPLPEKWMMVGSYYFEQEMLIQFYKLAETNLCKSGLYTYRGRYPDGRIIYTNAANN